MLTFLRHFRWLNHSDKIYFLGLALLVPIIKIFLHVFGFKKVAVFLSIRQELEQKTQPIWVR